MNYQVVNSGETSLGVRLNQVSWYKGAIKYVRVTNKALSPDEFVTIDEVSTSVNDYKLGQLDFDISPNPIDSSSEIRLQLDKREKVNIDLINPEGKVVKKIYRGFVNVGNQAINCDFSDIASGNYMLHVKSESKEGVKQIVITN